MKAILKNNKTTCKMSRLSKLKTFLKTIFVSGVISIVALTSLTACSSKTSKALNDLNENVLTTLNNSQVVQEYAERAYENFNFTGANFEDIDEKILSVDVYGISSWKEDATNKKGYATLNYLVEKSDFSEINNNTAKILSALSKAISKKQPKSFSTVEMNNIKSFNKTAKSFVENTGDDRYNYDDSLIFAVETPEIDETNQTVSFTVKSNVDFVHHWTTAMMMYTGSSFIPVIINHFDHDESIQTHQMKLNLTKEEISEIKENEALIFDKFAEFVNNNETSKYTISTINIQKDVEYNTNVSDNIDVEKLD